MNIVIVDDSPSCVQALIRLVEELGQGDPVPFTDPVAALHWCLTHDPDLILVDYTMPRLDGLDFLGAFRRAEGAAEVPVVMVTGAAQTELRHKALVLGAADFLAKPVDRIEFQARATNLLKLRRAHLALRDRAAVLAEEVRRVRGALAEREREAILFLSRAAEHKDPETGNHLLRMACYSRLIAEAMGLAEDEVDLIHTAAPMHDVGKIGIPDSILLKPGRLTAEETRHMQQHALFGYEILSGSQSPLLRCAADIAYCHHERFDGTGYPRRLRGSDIPLVGRIVALADVFDALTSVRPYKPAWPVAQAVAAIVDASGRQFDPACVTAFLARRETILPLVAA